jgi:hypothetical protein
MAYIVSQNRSILPGVVPGEIIVTTEAGTLQSVSLIQTIMVLSPLFNGAADIFGEIWLSSAESPTPTPIILLASGYFGFQETIGWTGEIALMASDAVYARFYSPLNVAARLAVRVAG